MEEILLSLLVLRTKPR